MLHLKKIFLTGMLISFLGSLPLGTLNVAAMQISISSGSVPALLFSSGALIAEMFYVRLSLIAMNWIRRKERLFRVLEWVTLVIVLALAASSFYAAMHPAHEKNIVLDSPLPKFILGLVMSLVNPVQIPFWFGWSTVLFSKKVLIPRNDHYNAYTIGIGLGTLLANFVFIFGGLLIANSLDRNQHVLNWVIGGIFTGTALVQIWKMLRKKDAVHQMDHLEEVTHGLEEKIIEFAEGHKTTEQK
jgi:threonine/homoserine/homoserine lactone efflux protein